MQMESRWAGGSLSGLRIFFRPLRCASAGPWQRSQEIPACVKSGEGYLLSVPGVGAWNPLVWQ